MKDMPTKSYPLNILVIGTGMYVCGRGTDGYGTILPAVYEWKRTGHQSGHMYVAGTQSKGVEIVRKKMAELRELTGIYVPIKYFPVNGQYNLRSYVDAIMEIPRPACAIVAVPDNLHREIAGACIENGLHTLVVKPLASTVKEVFELIDIQQSKQVYCAVEFHKRFDRSNLKLSDSIKAGHIGAPLYFLVEYSQRKIIPCKIFKKWVETVNIFQYLGVHYVDIIYFATGARPKRVMAVGQKNWLLSQGIDTYDSIQGIIEWEMMDGVKFTSTILTNWIDPESTSAMSDQKIKVIGTKGRYESNQKNRGIYLVTDEKGIEEPNPDFCCMYGSRKGDIVFQGYGIDSITQFLEDVTSVESGSLRIDDLELRRPTFRNSIIPTTIIEAVNRSLAENSRWINLRFENNRFMDFE